MSEHLQFPAPYFGGKSSIASQIWDALGDVDNYVEPFCGSCAVLWARPHAPRVETINDFDGFVTNFLRAIKAEPDAVADKMNWPVSEIDLEARHRFLVRQPDKDAFMQRMQHEPEYYDVQRAAWWCWGLAQWIGSGWCGGDYYGPDVPENHGRGTCNDAAKMPALCRGRGVHKKRPHLGDAGMGVHKKRPHLSYAGMGVHKQLPHLGNADGDGGEWDRRGRVLAEWMNALSHRLRNVRICCGSWDRVCSSEGTTTGHGTTGIFLDPPYGVNAKRMSDIYRVDSLSVAEDVLEFCLKANPDIRIVLAGYDGEHNALEKHGWNVVAWKAQGGYAHQSKDADSQGKKNAGRERLWFSPACIDESLFSALEAGE